jgi:thioredoxin reductase/NAD-dependent dihydropyrimidine dehydrogenase PreA subunit
VDSVWIYGALLIAIWGAYGARRALRHRRSRAAHGASVREGMTEPPSLHPVIDPARCLGCGACVPACPEGDVLGMIDGRAVLVEPTRCIGHGACREACPTNAITLVFGSATRGVEIPLVNAAFETSVPGVFIAGELGGMGLIRNAIEQGRRAIDSIRERNGKRDPSLLDVLIVGAGPAGLSASLAAKAHGLRFVTIEQDGIGGCVGHYPRGKVVMTAPAELPIIGRIRFSEIGKEELLEFWRDVERRAGLDIRYGERLEDVRRNADHFEAGTSRTVYAARNILLAIGRRGTPRKLGVPGEDRTKVVYRLVDPEQYRERKVLVVGGGDAALEAAASVAEAGAAAVALSYRATAFTRARPANRQRIEQLAGSGRVRVVLGSEVEAIHDDHVVLRHDGAVERIGNDAVIVCAGGVLPTTLLERIGVRTEVKHGTA